MEKDNRRNSILKPAGNIQLTADYDDEPTENFTVSRRKSMMKRVSFAGTDEVKEFLKHEALTVKKLEQDLLMKKIEHDMEQGSIGVSSGKENVAGQTGGHQNLNVSMNIVEDDMEITSVSLSASTELPMTIPSETLQTSTKDIAMDTISEPCLKIDCIAPSVEQSEDISIEEVEMQTSVCHEEIIPPPIPSNLIHEVTPSEVEGFCKKKASNETIASSKLPRNLSGNASSQEQLSVAPLMVNFFDEPNEFNRLLKEFRWEATRRESELTLSKLSRCLTLKFTLSNEFLFQNVRHFVVDDIEVDTEKNLKDKWARFGFTILETTLENSSLKSLCPTTQDIPKLLKMVEENVQIFLDFMIEDSDQFELLANPRSIKLDIERVELTFDLSNLENLVLVRITLSLFPSFPLSAKHIAIENIIGQTNKIELQNMITTIRPSGRYLTRVAECIEDFLKFRPSSGFKVLDVSRHQ